MPSNKPTNAESNKTTMVRRSVSSFEGQVTFFNSAHVPDKKAPFSNPRLTSEDCPPKGLAFALPANLSYFLMHKVPSTPGTKLPQLQSIWIISLVLRRRVCPLSAFTTSQRYYSAYVSFCHSSSNLKSLLLLQLQPSCRLRV